MESDSEESYYNQECSEWQPSHPQQVSEGDLQLARKSLKNKQSTKKTPLWTKVLSVNDDKVEDIKTYPLPADVQIANYIGRPRNNLDDEEWSPIFLPKAFRSENPELTLEDRKLTKAELEEYGILISKHRKQLREYAGEFDAAVAEALDSDINNPKTPKPQKTEIYNNLIS